VDAGVSVAGLEQPMRIMLTKRLKIARFFEGFIISNCVKVVDNSHIIIT
jgi:hypothetical protein